MGEGAWRLWVLAVGLVLAAAFGLGAFRGCGASRPAPTADRFQPARPTPPGALADAVRSAADRSGGAGAAGTPRTRDSVRDPGRMDGAGARDLQSASLLPPDPVVVRPEPLDAAQREAVERYLSLLARLNLELAGADGSRSPGAVARVSPVVDEMRGTLDGLLSLSAGQRLTVEREFGVRQRGLESELESRLDSLRSEAALTPLVTLVGDLPSLD